MILSKYRDCGRNERWQLKNYLKSIFHFILAGIREGTATPLPGLKFLYRFITSCKAV